MMIKTTLIILAITATLYWCGCSCCTSRQTESEIGRHIESPPYKNEGSPTAIKQNFSYVEAVVDSVIVIDESQYRLSIRLITVSPGSAAENLAEPGQILTVVPQFVKDAGGSSENDSDRNKRLLLLRSAKRGDKMSGNISRSADGRWFLIDAVIR